MEFIDLKSQQALIRERIDERIRVILDHGKYIMGPEVYELEKKLRNDLDIPSLKVRMNRQIGWFIEVTKTHENKVPEDWKRKQQMTNGSRYITEELLERDDLLLTADTKVKELEYRVFRQLREKCRDSVQLLAEIAGKVASIDVLQCLSLIHI